MKPDPTYYEANSMVPADAQHAVMAKYRQFNGELGHPFLVAMLHLDQWQCFALHGSKHRDETLYQAAGRLGDHLLEQHGLERVVVWSLGTMEPLSGSTLGVRPDAKEKLARILRGVE